MKNWFVFEDDESLSKDSRLQKRKQKLFTGSEVSLIQLQDKATTLKELNLFFDKVPVNSVLWIHFIFIWMRIPPKNLKRF